MRSISPRRPWSHRSVSACRSRRKASISLSISSVGILKEIYEAERRADRIVRDAEAEAKALVAESEAAGRAEAAARAGELARTVAGVVEAQTAEIRLDVDAFLRDREAEVDRWVRGRRDRIDRIVDRLVAMVLPP